MANQGRINFTVGFNIDQSGLNQLKSSLASLQNLKTSDLVNIDSKQATAELNNIKAAAKTVEVALQQSFNPALNTYNIDLFKKKLAESGTNVTKLKTEFTKAGAEGSVAFRNLATAITSTKLPLQETHDLIKSMGTTLMNTIKWSVASNAINTVTGSVQKAWGFTQDLDKSLNDIMIVTDKSAVSMERFARQANKAAKELGKSTTDYTKASLIYYQQGLDDADVKARTETTLKAANITSQSTDAVSQQLTAVWNGYKVQAAEAELYVDKLSAVAATTAADLEELSTGMSKVASAANNMGVDIDQLNAQLATIISVTKQAPESVGTALKTVYARISDIEAGISDEATLGEYTKQMAEMGINVLDSNNHLRDMGAVIEEIGSKWTTLNREQQISLAQTMAGTRQYNNLLALFENWNMYTKAIQTSANATGTLQQQQEEYMESLEAHLEQLSTASERVYDAFFDADSMKDLIDALTVGVDLLGNFVESIGGGGSMLMALVPVMTKLFSGSIADSAATFAINLGNARNNANLLASALASVQEIQKDDSIDKYTKNILKLRESFIVLKQQGILTNEAFNDLNNTLDESAQKANKIDEKRGQLDTTETRYNALFNNQLFSDLQEEGEIDFNALQESGKQAALRGLTIDASLAESIDYELGSSTLDSMKTKLAEIDQAGQKAARSITNMLQELAAGKDIDLQSIGVKFEELQRNAEELANTDWGKPLAQSISKALTGFEDLLTQPGATAENLDALQQKIISLTKLMNKATNAGIADLNELQAELEEITTGALPRMEQEAQGATDSLTRGLEKAELTAKIKQFTELASTIGMVASAFQLIGNLPSIWKNDDLTLGEKVLQTTMNISSVIGMLSPAVAAIVGWYKKLNTEMAIATVQSMTEAELEAVKAQIEDKITDEKKQQLIIDNLRAGTLTQEQIAELQKLGILKEQTKEKAKQAAIDKIKGGFKDFGSGFKSGFTSGGGKGAFSTKGLSGPGGVGQILGAVAPYALIAAAVIGTAVATYTIVDNINRKEEKAFADAQARTKALQANLEHVNSEYDTLESSLDNLASSTDAFEKLTEGTVEWEKALSDVNAQVVELLGKYPELYKYVETDEETGLMSISAEGQRLVKQQQLEELKAARAGAAAAQLQENEAAMAAKRDALAEKATGGIGDAGAIAGWGTAGLGAAGGVIGGVAAGAAAGSIVPVVGTIIGAAIGLGVGLLGSGIGVGIQEAQEEEYKANLDEQAIGEAYAQVGAAMFESEEALAKALNTTKDALTDEQKALLENKDAAIALAETVAKNTAQQKALLLQVGRGLVGEDATEGEALRAGKEYKEAYSAELKKLQDNAGGDTQDKKEALEYLAVLGLSEANFIGTKGTNRIQYLDANGDEQDISMNKVYAVLAEDRAKKAADRIVAAIDKNFKAMNNALSGFSSEQKEILSTLGTEEFSLQKATKLDLEKFADLNETQLQAIATANGVTLEEVRTQLKDKLDKANAAWDSPSNLEGEALSKFLSAAKGMKNLTLSQYNEYSNMFNQLFTRFGDESVNTLYTILQQAGDKSDELLADILDTVSWESYEAQGQIYELIAKYDLSDKINMDFVDEYISQMLRLNGIYGRSSEEIAATATAIKDIIADLYPGKLLSDADIEDLRTILPDIQRYLIASGDTDKPYVWTGKSTILANAQEQSILKDIEAQLNGVDQKIEDTKEGITKFEEAAEKYAQADENEKKLGRVVSDLHTGASGGWGLTTALTVDEIVDIIVGGKNFTGYVGTKDLPTDRWNRLTSEEQKTLIYNLVSQAGYANADTELVKLVERLWDQNTQDSENRAAADSLFAKGQEFTGTNSLEEAKHELESLNGQSYELLKEGIAHITTDSQINTFIEIAKKRLVDSPESYAEIISLAIEKEYSLAEQSFNSLAEVGALTVDSLRNYLTEMTKGLEGTEKLKAIQEVLAGLRLGTKRWDIAISDLEDSLTSLDYELEGLTGVNAFENISKQVDILNQQLGFTEQKVNSLKDFNVDTLRAAGVALNTALAQSGYNFNVNNIVNEEGEINQGVYAAVLQMAAEHGDDAIGTALNTYITSIEQYIEQQKKGEEEIYKARKAYQDALCEEYEKWLETITSGDVIKKQINALQREVGELTGNRGLVAETLLGDFAINQNLISDYTDAYSELERKRKEGMTDQEYAERLEALIAQHQAAILENAQAYLTASNQIVEGLEEISALYEEQISYLEQLSALTETQANAYSLIYGDTNYASMAGYYERQLDYATQISNAAQAKYEQLKGEIFNEDGSYTKMFNQLSAEAQATLLQQFADAGQASADAFYSELEARQQVWQNEIEVALDRMTKNLFGNANFSLLKEQWEWMRDQGDKYFDSIERGYEMTSLSLMFDKAIADTKDIKAQQAIAKLKKEQLEHMESIVNLSEYDVTMAEKKLNLLQAEIALRDAEANKTQMRLMRGANGAYSYQYVADQNAINKAREELNKAQSDMYEFSKQSAEDAVSAFYQGYEDILELIRNFYADGTISEQEQKIIDEREAAWLANAEKSEQITGEFRDIMSTSLSDFQGSLTGTSDITIAEISNSIFGTIAQLSNGGFQAAFNEIINGAGGLKETSEKFMRDQEALFKQINQLLTGSDDGAGDSGLLAAIAKIVNKYNGKDGLIAAETAEYNLLKDKLVPQLATLKANYENVGAAVAELIAKYHALAAAKAAADNVSMPQRDDMSWFLHKNPETNSADWNGDGKITMADYEAWRDNDIYGAKSSLLQDDKDSWSAEENDTAYGYQVSGNRHYADKHNRVTMDAYIESLITETDKPENKGGAKIDDNGGGGPPQEEPTPPPYKYLWDSSVLSQNTQVEIKKRGGEYTIYAKQGDTLTPVRIPNDDLNNVSFRVVSGAVYANLVGESPEKQFMSFKPDENVGSLVTKGQEYFIPIENINKWKGTAWYFNKFDTGGYTGAWGDSSGRLAMLHEKELVLNKVDTANILKAVDLVRSLESSMLNSMGQWQAGALASSAAWELAQDMVIEQNVHIEANFPNVSVKKEIEEAFEDIINLAAQYANEF